MAIRLKSDAGSVHVQPELDLLEAIFCILKYCSFRVSSIRHSDPFGRSAGIVIINYIPLISIN